MTSGTVARKTAIQRGAPSLSSRHASRKPRRSIFRRSTSRESKAAVGDVVAEAEDAAELKAAAGEVAATAGTLATSGEYPRTANPRSV